MSKPNFKFSRPGESEDLWQVRGGGSLSFISGRWRSCSLISAYVVTIFLIIDKSILKLFSKYHKISKFPKF